MLPVHLYASSSCGSPKLLLLPWDKSSGMSDGIESNPRCYYSTVYLLACVCVYVYVYVTVVIF